MLGAESPLTTDHERQSLAANLTDTPDGTQSHNCNECGRIAVLEDISEVFNAEKIVHAKSVLMKHGSHFSTEGRASRHIFRGVRSER